MLVVALLAATAAAFALTQGLKNQPAGIFGTQVPRDIFSPVCDCGSDQASITFKLRNPDRLDVSVVDGSERVVSTIEDDREHERGLVAIQWDGRDDAGRVLPEGAYKLRVRLRDDRTTYTLPNPIRIDVTRPQLELVSAGPRVISPDGDRRRDLVTFRYRLNEPGRGMLFVNGTRRVRKLFARTEDSIVWYGKVEQARAPSGLVFRPGRRGRSRRQRLGANAADSARDPLRDAQSQANLGQRGRGVRAEHRVRCASRALVDRRAERSRASRPPAPACAAAAGAVHADRLGQRSRESGRGVRAGADALSELARLAGPLGCAGLALLLVATRRDLRLAGLAAWVLGMAGLCLYLAPDGRTKALVAAGAVGVVLAAAGGALLLRRPWVLAFATLACIPIRIPVDVGTEDANLLLPLYAVVASLVAALGWQLVRGDGRSRELGPIAFPLAAVVAWTGLALLWTDDLRQGAIFLAAFVLPFGLLAIGFARLPFSRRALLGLYAALVATALAYAGVGLYQWITREVFWNPKLQVDNAYAPFFRVNSVFWDPSIYGRYLVIAILATLGFVLLGLRARLLAAGIAAIAFMWLGLLFSFSQSSFAALLAGTLAAATFVWRWRAITALALVAVVIVAIVFATPQVRRELLEQSRAGLNAATSGRAGLVSNGLKIARDHPVFGVGTGGFKHAYAERTGLRGADPKKAASHSTPVTVAAETGIPGLALLAWLGFASLVAAYRARGRSAAGGAARAAGLTLGAIAVHSLFYNALFEDPTVWGLLGLIALAVAARSEEVAPA